MKRTLLSLVCYLVALISWAQAPNFFDFQSLIRDETGNFVTNKTIGVRISLLQGTIDGEAVYIETHTKSTNANGLLTLTIGGGTTSSNMSTIDWGQGPYFIKTEMDLEGGTNYTLSNTTQMMSVPYALYAAKAGEVTSSGSTGQSIHYVEDVLDNLIASVCPPGFSVDASTQVYFAPGNLQYQKGTHAWRFAEHQYDVLSDNDPNNWMDLMPWGSDGMQSDQRTVLYPDRYSGLPSYPDIYYFFTNEQAWFNKIADMKDYRLLTETQLDYILHSRPRANELRAQGTINGINGLILLPDNWYLYAHSVTFVPLAEDYNTNIYSDIQWREMEQQGAVFLPQGVYWLTLLRKDGSYMYFYAINTTTSTITNMNKSTCNYVRGVKYTK